MKKRIKVIRGGQGAGKTISILILLINHASSQPNKEILIISSELTKMRLTVIKDFIKVMQLAGIYEERRFIASTLYKYPNGSFIKFIGLDKADVGKGLRSDIAYFNEVNKCDQESYRQVATRANMVFADYNPDAEFYIDRDVIPRDDCDFLQLTYADNEELNPTEREEILRYKTKGYNLDGTVLNSYWANLWQVYGLGNVGSLYGTVFSNWQEIESLPTEARLLGYGMDFGYTNDPTTLIAAYKYNDQIIWDEVIYQKGLLNSAIAKIMKSNKVTLTTYADSAEPKSIAELRSYDLMVVATKKGADSISYGINLMQGLEMVVTKRSVNIIKELRNYTWDKSKTGESLNKPIDNYNHAIDAMRYFCMSHYSNRSSGEYYY